MLSIYLLNKNSFKFFNCHPVRPLPKIRNRFPPRCFSLRGTSMSKFFRVLFSTPPRGDYGGVDNPACPHKRGCINLLFDLILWNSLNCSIGNESLNGKNCDIWIRASAASNALQTHPVALKSLLKVCQARSASQRGFCGPRSCPFHRHDWNRYPVS